MNKKIKRAILLITIVILIIVVTISTYFIVKYLKEKKKIENVCENYSDENISNRISTEEIKNRDDLIMKIDGKDVVGVIKIDKIGFEGLIYDGTDWDTLAKGVGHFENSTYLNGNVCLAAHNTNKFWSKLHTLEMNDIITYISFLGTKEYEVCNITKIDETDWNLLENTEENMITLITCIKGEHNKRLCVQAVEI